MFANSYLFLPYFRVLESFFLLHAREETLSVMFYVVISTFIHTEPDVRLKTSNLYHYVKYHKAMCFIVLMRYALGVFIIEQKLATLHQLMNYMLWIIIWCQIYAHYEDTESLSSPVNCISFSVTEFSLRTIWILCHWTCFCFYVESIVLFILHLLSFVILILYINQK